VNKLKEKYFDYNGMSPDRLDNPEKNTLTTSSSISFTADGFAQDTHTYKWWRK
jgi:hypothetical protein